MPNSYPQTQLITPTHNLICVHINPPCSGERLIILDGSAPVTTLPMVEIGVKNG